MIRIGRRTLAVVLSFASGLAHAATKTYTSPWSGGTIAPGDTAVIENGGGITGNVVANGTLQFNQTTTVSMNGTKDRSANGTSASVGRAGRIMSSSRRSWLGRMRPDRGGAAVLPVHAQGQIFLVGADRP